MSSKSKVARLLVVTGIIVGILGIIFYLQGNAVVGPSSSFMYSSPRWVVNGLAISAIGFAAFGAGILVMLVRRAS